jgi:hypothetical protein
MGHRRSLLALVGFALAVGLGRVNVAPTLAASADDTWTADQESSVSSFSAKVIDEGAFGSFVDTETGQLVVVVPTAVAAHFSLGDVSGLRWPVVVRSLALDPAEVSRVNAALAKYQSSGALGNSSAFMLNVRTGKVDLYTDLPSAGVQSLMGSYWDLVSYHAGGVIATSRQSDTPPFWGGASTTDFATKTCTTSFTVKNGAGTKYLLTAGHCFANGVSAESPGNHDLQGIVQNRLCVGSGYDIEELHSSTYAGEIYVGAGGGTGSVVTSAGNPGLNVTYHYSGQTTLDNTVIPFDLDSPVDFGVTDGCGVVQHVVSAQNSAGLCPVRGGDSGGPMYLPGSSGTNAIRGIVLGLTPDQTVCFFEKWTQIASGLGVTIVPG